MFSHSGSRPIEKKKGGGLAAAPVQLPASCFSLVALRRALDIGRPVRIIRDPYFGVIGTVSALPHEPAVLGSGSKARVLEVKFESGQRVMIPRANVELIEG